MAVSAAEETFQDRDIVKSGDGGSRTRVYFVSVTNSDPAVDDPLTASGLPADGDAHPADSYLIVTSRSASNEGGTWKLWKIRVEYQPKDVAARENRDISPKSQNEDSNQNPTSDPPIKSGSSSFITVAPQKDLADRRICNSAGEPFVQPPTIDKPIVEITRMVNLATEPIAFIIAFAGKCNGSAFLGFPARTLMVKEVSYTSKYWRNKSTGAMTEYFPTTIRLAYNPDGWTPTKVWDMGLKEKAGGKLKVIYADGYPVSVPHPLNGAGVKTPNMTDTPAELSFMLIGEANLQGLGITS